MTSTTQPTTHQPQQGFTPARMTFGTVLAGGTCAAAAGLFTTMSPLGGAIFGASGFLCSRLIHWIYDKVNCCPDNIIFKVAQSVLPIIGGIAAGAFITSAIGFPMTIMTGVLLSAASIAVTFAALIALGGCLCSSAAATGIILGRNDEGISVRTAVTGS